MQVQYFFDDGWAGMPQECREVELAILLPEYSVEYIPRMELFWLKNLDIVVGIVNAQRLEEFWVPSRSDFAAGASWVTTKLR